MTGKKTAMLWILGLALLAGSVNYAQTYTRLNHPLAKRTQERVKTSLTDPRVLDFAADTKVQTEPGVYSSTTLVMGTYTMESWDGYKQRYRYSDLYSQTPGGWVPVYDRPLKTMISEEPRPEPDMRVYGPKPRLD
jgi:hypothetical protein